MKHTQYYNETIGQYILRIGQTNYNDNYGYFDRRINKWIVPKEQDISEQIQEDIKIIIRTIQNDG